MQLCQSKGKAKAEGEKVGRDQLVVIQIIP